MQSSSIHHLVLIGIPLMFYLCGGAGRILIRSSQHLWDRQDWYLSTDAMLANLAAGLLYIGESLVNGAGENLVVRDTHIAFAALYVACSLTLYLFFLCLHRKLGTTARHGGLQLVVLVIACNASAIGAMVAFISLIKGI